MNLRDRVAEMDSIVLQGAIVDAVKKYFADDAKTSDYGNVATADKAAMVEKMEGFAASIAKVNNIELHNRLVDGNLSASEFTFDFEMKDGSKILWHEIIRRTWNQAGEVIQEIYFNAE